MVTIPTYQARQGLETPRAPELPGQVPVDTSVGQALDAVGGALAGFGQYIDQRDQQKASFNAQIGYDTLQEQLNQDLLEYRRNAPADGSGIHDTFVQKSFGPKTEAFLGTITDKKLQEQFRARIGSLDRERWGNEAGNAEYEQGNAYSQQQISTMWGKRTQAIAQDPAAVENYVSEMVGIIDSAPYLTTAQREEAKAKVRENAPSIVAEALKQTDPETLYFSTGNGTRDERINFLLKRIVPVLTQAESGGDPNAVSKKGALGLMQVMPDTAVDIAKKIGDQTFLSLPPAKRADYLARPDVNVRYGTAYLGMQLDKYNGDVEAALIAYNAGPGNADKWLAAGRDYAALPKREETEPYVASIMGGLGSAKFAAGAGVSRAASERIPLTTGTQPGRQPLDLKGLNPQLIDRWEQVQTAFGRAVPVVSGNRDAARNAKAGGARGSQHLYGNAIDLDVAGMSKAERIRLLETASAMGFSGIGVYRNSIHLDMREGSRAVWGPTYRSGSVPAWAFTFAAQHRGGQIAKAPAQDGQGGFTTASFTPGQAPTQGSPVAYSGAPRSGFVSPIFAEMPVAELQRWQDGAADLRLKADDAIKQQKEQAKVAAQSLIADDIASIQQKGEGAISASDIETRSAQLLTAVGPEEHTKWLQDRAVAQRVYNLAADAESMPQQSMTTLLQSLTPKGGENAAAQQKVYDEVQKRFDAVTKLRTDDPGLAVLQTPALREAASNLNWSKPEQVQQFLSDVEASQTILGVSRALLPKAQAEQIGAQIRNVIAANPGLEDDATRSVLLKLQQTYGNYADDVFTQAFETILEKDLSKTTRELMSNTMLGWVQGTPGMQDSRFMLQNAAATAGELAAMDKQPGLGDEPPTRSWWGYFTGEPLPEAPPPPPAPVQELPPKVEFQPITIDGVPPEAVDTFTKNAGSMRVQSMFRDAYGAPALKAMQDELKRRGAFAAAN